MANPGGNYPGRQMFLGGIGGLQAFVYLVTGRSQDSKERYATPFLPSENAIRIKPIDQTKPFDPFRHYQAVRIDLETGIAVVSNSQAPVDAVFEAYKFMPDAEKLEGGYLERLLRAIGPEYDNPDKPTSRIVGVTFQAGNDRLNVLGITPQKNRGYEIKFRLPGDNTLLWVSTYNGDVDYRNFAPKYLGEMRTVFHPDATTAQELADEIFELSDYVDPRYDELRVCTIAGVRNGNGPGGWEIKRRNKHKVE